MIWSGVPAAWRVHVRDRFAGERVKEEEAYTTFCNALYDYCESNCNVGIVTYI